ncbi:unnamed protein product [Eretmochelys imbricata]
MSMASAPQEIAGPAGSGATLTTQRERATGPITTPLAPRRAPPVTTTSNPGYYDLQSQDLSVWHVTNKTPLKEWKNRSILRNHTGTGFLSSGGGEPPQTLPVEIWRWCLKDQQWPRRARHLRLWRCPANCQLLLSKWPKSEFVPGYIQFCVFNSEKAAMALCAGVKVTGCNTEHHCVGGGGFFPEGNPVQCGDFASFDWNSYGTHQHWSISKEMIESAVLLFYR